MNDNHFALLTRAKEFATVMQSVSCTNALTETIEIENGLSEITELMQKQFDRGGHIYIIGNGGSAAVANHAVTDLVNVGRLRAFTLHDGILMTCMANDFGYDQAFKRLVETIVKKEDILIAISGSGKSKNICSAVQEAIKIGASVITLSGFSFDNPLRAMGHYNFWLNSCDYGLIEMSHLFILHNLTDRDRKAIAFKDAEKIKCIRELG